MFPSAWKCTGTASITKSAFESDSKSVVVSISDFISSAASPVIFFFAMSFCNSVPSASTY